MSNTVYAFHLLNDLSGSPKVLSQLLKAWTNKGMKVHLYTSLHQKGFLSDIPGVIYHHAWYRFSPNPWLRLVTYTLSQLMLFVRLLFVLKKNDAVYVNTVLPFGAALAGRVRSCRVLYHIHESTVNPPVLKWFLFRNVATTASGIINVSEFVQQAHGIKTVPNYLVYNAIEDKFVQEALPKTPSALPRNILMVCSLKVYKGLYEFINLASACPQYSFRLVLNATQADIDSFFSGTKLPPNIEIFAAQTNLHPFYQWADLILNLSRPDGWVETFGLTIIEGMVYGLPAIVPPVGGILEVIEDGETGFAVDSRNSEQLKLRVLTILQNPDLYHQFSARVHQRLKLFREQAFVEKIDRVFEKNMLK